MYCIPMDITSFCFTFLLQEQSCSKKSFCVSQWCSVQSTHVSHQCLVCFYKPCVFSALSSSSSLSVLQLTNLTEIHDQISGMARCPYNPLHNSTALITSSGELYAATAMDFSGRDPAIYRSLGGLPPLRTAQYNSKWLNGRDVAKSGTCVDVTYLKCAT